MKTKKWVQAKKNAYDGDDWGDYDEYDEYGVNQEPPSQEEQPAAQRYYAQHAEQPSRSFTDPYQQGLPLKARRNSFEHGEEQRAFSSSIPQQAQGQYYEEPPRQSTGAGYEDDYSPEQQRDFSPTAMPPPLQTRISQVPADFTASPSNTQFPPRKSSIGQADAPTATSPRQRAGSQSDKPLPFIRPADIYRRVEEERVRERASLDSSRPSLDSLSSRPRDDPASPQAEGGKLLPPLETVAERKSEYLPDFDAAFAQNGKQPAQTGHSQPLVGHPSTMSPHDDQGFRSVVDNAFIRNDDQRSIPPTPISKDSNSEMSRTNTGSTSGISPIMSRVPSSATSALKARNQTGAEGSTPAIAEEVNEATTPVPQTTSGFGSDATHHTPPATTHGHARNFSGASLPRSGFATPTRGDSPARLSVLAAPNDFPEPVTAQITSESLDGPGEMEGGLQGPSPAYAIREADIASAMKSNPVGSSHQLSAAETQSQNTFLESHNAQSPIADALPRDRSESPSKGRVQALAGRFGDVSHSRRGSTQSNTSRNSVQSWERSQDNSRAASPTKGSPGKPSSPTKEFRPHLPGQWESYATTAMTPSEHSDREQEQGYGRNRVHSPLEEVDFTPTTDKRPVAEGGPSDFTDPLTALRDAGAAMVHSIRTTVGLDDTSPDTQQTPKGQSNHGDVYLPRPLQLDRSISAQSTVPPTPPAKDTPRSEFPPTPIAKEIGLGSDPQQVRPSLDPQLSMDPSVEDQESDRLRKEIVASLSPVKTSSTPFDDTKRSSLQPLDPSANRTSSILPSEYDTYWAEEDQAPRNLTHDVERTAPVLPSTLAATPNTHTDELAKPEILNRFSWEGNNTQIQPLTGHTQEPPAVESTKTLQEEKSISPAVGHADDQERHQWSEGIADSYFGPGHTFTVTKPDPISVSELGQRSPTTPLDHTRTLASPTREQTRSPGLHVVNTEVDPEAVDLPPRFSADHQQAPRLSQDDKPSSVVHPASDTALPAIGTSNDTPKTPIAADFSGKSPTTDKPLGAREIATISSTAERIATYNSTREHWATADHGLHDWLASTLQSNPDLATQTYPVQRMPTGSARHRHTGSLAILGKLGGTSHNEQSTEQFNTTGSQVPASATSPTAGRPAGPGFGGRVASQQMQLKGEKLLHTANVLSGKGMTSAKGLFAKGKSRFGRDKVDK